MYSLSSMSLVLSCAIFSAVPAAAQNFFSPTQIASVHGLPSSVSLPFPTKTLSSEDAITFLKASTWDLTRHGDISNEADVSFVKDPLNSTNKDPVLTILYPAGSYSNNTGGTTFSTYYNDSSSTGFRTMQISYQVAFESGFQFVKGGKLPGLRGGVDRGCDGGSNSDTCFSTRFMWRTNGEGEAYVYTQGQKTLCQQSNVRCSDFGYGTSISRGSFSFVAGAWNQVDMVVGLNNPVARSNGYITVYYNGALAINQTGMQIRSNSAVQNIQGMFFSTFFGGGDSSWESPSDQHTYFKNIQLFASDNPSNLKSSALSTRSSALVIALILTAITITIGAFS